MGKEYVCTLDAATEKKAREELNEVPSDRMAAVKALRDWHLQQPHLNTPHYDPLQYLMFLRGAKFSQLRARELIESFMMVKHIAPEWANDIDTKEAKIDRLLTDGYAVPLPKRTKEGCQIMLYRPGRLDENLKRYSRDDTVRISMVAGAYCAMSEMTQVNGTVFIMDFTGYTSKHAASQTNAAHIKKFTKLWQKNLPGRFKQIHFYNAGFAFDALMALMKPFCSKKFIDRIQTHDNLESLYKHVPLECLPEEYLPDEYTGPTVGSIDVIKENFKNEVQGSEFREILLENTSSKYGINLKKMPKKDDIQQSFRKLTVD